MNSEKYFESIINYSDCDGILENELVTSLEDNDMEELFEQVYYECNVKPLFYQVLQEVRTNANPIRNAAYHVKHKLDKNYQYYYGDTKKVKLKPALYQKISYFNKEKQDKNGNTNSIVSKEIRDDNTKKIIGWLEYRKLITKNEKKIAYGLKLKTKDMMTFNSLLIRDTAEEVVDLFEKEKVDQIQWNAVNDLNNPVVRSYKNILSVFEKTPITEKDGKTLNYSITSADWEKYGSAFKKKYVDRFRRTN